MKPQLLEDIGDSQSPLDIRSDLPTLKIYSMARAPAPQPLPRSHFGVWRDRQLDAKPAEQVRVEMPAEVLSQPPTGDEPFLGTVDEKIAVNDASEDRFAPPPEEIFIEPFEPMRAQPTPSPKTGRLAAWTSVLVVLALVAGGSLWFYKDRKDEASLAMLADNISEAPTVVAAAPTPKVQTPVPVRAESIPPLVVLKPEEAAAVEPEKVAEVVVPLAETPVKPIAKVAAKPRPSMRNVRKTATVKAEPRRTVVKAQTPVEVAPASAFAKACSALGYREAQCRKRACVLTKFGLACKG